MKLRLSYDVEPGGWATLRLWDERGDVTIVASYLHDSLLELVEAASVLAAGAQSAEVTFVEEPSHVVLYLGPVVGGEVPLALVRYPDWPERHEGQGEVVLRTRAPTD